VEDSVMGLLGGTFHLMHLEGLQVFLPSVLGKVKNTLYRDCHQPGKSWTTYQKINYYLLDT